MTFEKSQSLGGHNSKAHKGMSGVYKRKMLVRDQREGARKILREA